MVIIISRLFVVVVVATLPSSFVTLAAETTKLRVVIFIFIFWKYDDFARSEDIKLVAREFNKDEDGKQKDAFIVLFAFITCKLRARDESDDLRDVLGKSLQKKDAHETTLLCPLYPPLSRRTTLTRTTETTTETTAAFQLVFFILREALLPDDDRTRGKDVEKKKD